VIAVTWHRILSPGEPPDPDRYWIGADLWRRQVAALAGKLITPRAFFEGAETPGARRSHEVLVTCDDGYASDHEHVFRAVGEGLLPGFVCFVLTGRIGAAGSLSAAAIREMSDAGIVIGSHGGSHVAVDELGDAERDRELRDSRRRLEDLTSRAVDCFSFPFGRLDAAACDAARAAGYRRFFTSDGGYHRGWAPGLYNRTTLGGWMDPGDVARLVADPLCFHPARTRWLDRLGLLAAARRLRHRTVLGRAIGSAARQDPSLSRHRGMS
jgi:peptidoglycan/xylan/chitin deacetylase (PgdA/CDA1 family)